MAVLWSLTCAAVKLSLFHENNLSNTISHRVKSRTEAVNHLSRSLETWKMLKIILSKLKFQNTRISDTTPNSVLTSTWLCVTSNMKSSTHKTWQTSLLFLKPLQIQNLKRKTWGTWHIIPPPSEKVWGTRPPCPPPNCAHDVTRSDAKHWNRDRSTTD